jgi:hypothetical protein
VRHPGACHAILYLAPAHTDRKFFAKWGAACEGAFWQPGTFEAAHEDNQHDANDTVLDADEVAVAVRAFMQLRLKWEGTATDFQKALEINRFGEDKHRPKGWPATTSNLATRLRRAATSLRRAGIQVEFSRSGLLLRSSFAILAARMRHLISVARMPAFSVGSRLSNASDILLSNIFRAAPIGRLVRAPGSKF